VLIEAMSLEAWLVRLIGFGLCSFVGAFVGTAHAVEEIRQGQAAYDTTPVDWTLYEKYWVEGIPKAEADEPFLATFDPQKATALLDDVALKWTRQNKCATCHTNVSYLMVRPLLGSEAAEATREIRQTLKEYAVTAKGGPPELESFFIAPIASALAVNDGLRGGALDPDTRQLLNYLWTLQQSDGGWKYTTHDMLPFLERDFYYVALLVALAVGYAPDAYSASDEAKAGLAKLQSFIRNRPPENLHDKAVLLWASVRTPGLISSEQQVAYERALLGSQQKDGGWTLPSLGSWPRKDGAPNDPNGLSDGYATGLVAMALCQRGRTERDVSVARAIRWLRSHQRVSGRWYTRSTYSDRFRNYISNMGTAYALMAIDRCSRRDTTDGR
jgi:squalene-hopene/tetraprenyl-beta-curcumene cyclase